MNYERRRSLKELRVKAKQTSRATNVKHDIHHRKCVSRGGSNDESNISIVPAKLHECWHSLFQNLSPEAIAQVITQRWIDPDYELVARKKFKVS